MIHNRLQPLLAIITLLSVSPIISMDDPKIPTISFKDKTREELNQYALEHEVRDLSPHSKKSLEDRMKEVGITPDTRDFIYTALASDGSRPVNYDTAPFIFARIPYLLAQKKAADSQK